MWLVFAGSFAGCKTGGWQTAVNTSMAKDLAALQQSQQALQSKGGEVLHSSYKIKKSALKSLSLPNINFPKPCQDLKEIKIC